MGVKKGVKRGPYKTKNKIQQPVSVEKNILLDKNRFVKDIPLTERLIDLSTLKTEIVLPGETVSPSEEKINEVIEKEIIKTEKEANGNFEKSGEESMKEFLSEFKDVTPPANSENPEPEKIRKPRQKKESEQVLAENNAMLFNGTMLIAMCDFAFPGILKFLFKNIGGNKLAAKVKHADVVLNSDQIRSIEPVSDHAAKVIFEKVHPMVLFFLGMSVMYGMNFKMALDRVEKENPELLEAKTKKK